MDQILPFRNKMYCPNKKEFQQLKKSYISNITFHSLRQKKKKKKKKKKKQRTHI